MVIRVGQGRQHVLDVLSELGREKRVKVVFTLSLALPQTQRLFSSTRLFRVLPAHDDGRVGGQRNGRDIDHWVGGWMDG